MAREKKFNAYAQTYDVGIRGGGGLFWECDDVRCDSGEVVTWLNSDGGSVTVM